MILSVENRLRTSAMAFLQYDPKFMMPYDAVEHILLPTLLAYQTKVSFSLRYRKVLSLRQGGACG